MLINTRWRSKSPTPDGESKHTLSITRKSVYVYAPYYRGDCISHDSLVTIVEKKHELEQQCRCITYVHITHTMIVGVGLAWDMRLAGVAA